MSEKKKDGRAVEHLTTAECWRLLERADLGRVAVSAGSGSADIFPVNYVARSGHLYIRTAPGVKLAELTASTTVAFEVDGSDGVFRWSVVVHASSEALRLLDDAPLEAIPTAHPGSKTILVRLLPSSVSGRRFRDARTSLRTSSVDHDGHSNNRRKPVPIAHFAPLPGAARHDPGVDVSAVDVDPPRDLRP